ncbi:MAG: cupin domain-containing protein [Candidatus Eremiobacteraeota bacterium]|nr:cupin domain-containing protein [Candidatus Eremiobacteraeota bacterium]
MRKINAGQIDWEVAQSSPSGKFQRFGRRISEALGRDKGSTDLDKRHPFDVEIARVPPGAASCPYHSHSAQWEFFQIILGTGTVRDSDGTTPIEEGDAFLFKPGEPHQIRNDGRQDLIYLVVADNPIGETCYYPDSRKWAVKSPEYRLMRSGPLDYYDSEE